MVVQHRNASERAQRQRHQRPDATLPWQHERVYMHVADLVKCVVKPSTRLSSGV